MLAWPVDVDAAADLMLIRRGCCACCCSSSAASGFNPSCANGFCVGWDEEGEGAAAGAVAGVVEGSAFCVDGDDAELSETFWLLVPGEDDCPPSFARRLLRIYFVPVSDVQIHDGLYTMTQRGAGHTGRRVAYLVRVVLGFGHDRIRCKP